MNAGTPHRTVVLLHAAGRGPDQWEPQVKALRDDFDVLTPALGDTRPGGRFGVEAAADEVAELIGRHSTGRAAVCGISLGAFVALEMAIRHPERVDALILSGGQARPSRLLLGLNYALLNVHPPRMVVTDGGSRRAFLAAYRSLFTWDARPRLGRVGAPTMVLAGTRDRANLPAARELAAGIPGADLVLVPGAGHLWNVTHADTFTRVVREFLASHP
jgi:pimeloyl-ACP methyl ester carboxylesterase